MSVDSLWRDGGTSVHSKNVLSSACKSKATETYIKAKGQNFEATEKKPEKCTYQRLERPISGRKKH